MVGLCVFGSGESIAQRSAAEFFEDGNSKARSGDFADALQAYSGGIAMNPDHAPSYFNRDLAIELNNSYTTDADKAVYSGPINRGAQDRLRNVVQAQFTIEDLSPERAEAFFVRGIAKSKSGDTKEAIADLNSAIDLNPTYAEAYFSRGLVRSSIGDQMGAVLDCGSAIKLNATYPEAFYVRGIVKHSLGDVNGGWLDLSKVGELGYTID